MVRGPAMGGFRHLGARPGGYAIRSGVGRPIAARGAWGHPGWRHAGWRHGHHRFHGAWPFFAGVGALAWGAAVYNNSCLAWDGYAWVNVCYDPYVYGYPVYGY
jgi:hypothetical protein